MARPIQLSEPPRDPRAELQSRLQAAPAEHAEAILNALEVLQGLNDCGILELLRGALGSSEQVLEIAVHAANSPKSIRGIRNLILLVNMLGEIDPEQLKNVTQAVPQSLSATSRESTPPGLFKLAGKALWSSDFLRGLSTATTLLEAIGRNEGVESKT